MVYFQDNRNKILSRKAAEQAYYSQFSFQPQVNPKSRKIGRPTPLEELVKNQRSEKVRFFFFFKCYDLKGKKNLSSNLLMNKKK